MVYKLKHAVVAISSIRHIINQMQNKEKTVEIPLHMGFWCIDVYGGLFNVGMPISIQTFFPAYFTLQAQQELQSRRYHASVLYQC